MFSKEVGINLGTANLLMYVKSEGIVIDEPSVVAIGAGAKKCLAAGQDAKDMLGRTSSKVLVIHPLRDRVITDFEATKAMPNFFFEKLVIKGMFRRPAVLICYPSNTTSVERSAIRDVTYRTGMKKVYIERESKVIAVGAGLDIGKPSGCMVLGVGGGTTDVAMVSLGEIVSSTSLKITGDTLDRDIIKFVKGNKKLLIGDRATEEVKKRVGTAWKGNMRETIEINGRGLVTGLPTTIILSSEEIQGSMAKSLQDVVRACKTILEQTPPGLASDIVARGIVLTGSGVLLHGIDELLHNGLHIPVYVTENALHCVTEGMGILLKNLYLVQ